MKYFWLLLLFLLPLSPIHSDSESPSEDLVLKTLAQDIDTASYYELVAWCRELGLDDSGGRKELQERLFSHFNIESVKEPDVEEEEKKTRLEIKSAKETEYFSIQEVDEDYILLQGDVLVEVQDKDAVHIIRAQRIILNKTMDIITAEGDIEYKLIRGEQEEVFKGEKLTFNVDTWEGVFFHGGLESEKDIEGEIITFSYTGKTISKLKNETVILDSGVITSSKPVDPYYHIRAKKIWVLAPGEWAIWNAVLYVGRVPVLYIPFFFLPGDEFFFHPAIGYKEREGAFLQTTAYLIGRKERKESPISFLAATEDESTQVKRKIRGLFLRQTDEEIPPDEKEWFLKVLLDAYSRLGGLAGIAGDFFPYVSFQAGIGFSRSIFTEGGIYTPFHRDDGRYKSYWNKSWIFGAELPFRYGFNSDWDIGKEDYKLSGNFEMYSDPYFTSDFYNRAEDIDWSGMLGLDEESEAQDLFAEKLNLSWELSGEANFSNFFTTPLLTTLSISYLNASFIWQSREVEGISLDPVLAVDPSRRFYYPVNFILPSTALQIKGDILSLPVSAGVEGEESNAQPGEEEPGKGYRTPGEFEHESPLSDEEDKNDQEEYPSFRLPELKEDLPEKIEKEPISFLLSYQISPSMILEQSFDSEDWKKRSDVDFAAQYTTLETSGSISLDSQMHVLEDLIGLSASLLYSGSYRTRYKQSHEENDAWEALVIGDYTSNCSDFGTSLAADLFPFFETETIAQSKLSYDLDWTFYSYIYNVGASSYQNPVYHGYGPKWNHETVEEHSAEAAFIYQPYQRANSLSISAELPPLQGEFTGILEFYIWLLKTTIQSVFLEEGDYYQGWRRWDPEPIVAQETLELSEDVNLLEEIHFDAEKSLVLKSISSIVLWGFSASFTAERLKPVYFTGSEWKETGEDEQFLPSNVTLGYEFIRDPYYLWRNRIKLELLMNTSWSMDLQEFSENYMDFSFGLNLFIYKFLEISFNATSYNNKTYRYFPGFAQKLGEPWVNPITDLLKSFNFASREDRLSSSFKLKSFSLSAVHHLHDWDLTFTYTGSPVLVTDPDGKLKYEWESSFSIFLQWIPIPEMKSNIRYDPTGFYLRG